MGKLIHRNRRAHLPLRLARFAGPHPILIQRDPHLSRMKANATTLAAGYAAIGGFNLRQLSRHQLGKKIKPMT